MSTSTLLYLETALEYARAHALEALIVASGKRILNEVYENAFTAEKAHALYSGTKSFWGIAACCAERDGLLALDERVAETFAAWQNDPWKRRVTLRMLLSLTAGFGFGGLGNAVPTGDRALATPLKNEPGSTFTYGGIPLQVFGAVLARKLEPQRLTPQQYLTERVLDPAGVSIERWRSLPDGTQPLPTGAFLRARAWLTYGRYVLRERANYHETLQGSNANPRYGLGWWLAPKGAPQDCFYASGSGGQALYLIPSLDAVVVHFGSRASYKHEAFLRRLLNPSA